PLLQRFAIDDVHAINPAAAAGLFDLAQVGKLRAVRRNGDASPKVSFRVLRPSLVRDRIRGDGHFARTIALPPGACHHAAIERDARFHSRSFKGSYITL